MSTKQTVADQAFEADYHQRYFYTLRRLGLNEQAEERASESTPHKQECHEIWRAAWTARGVADIAAVEAAYDLCLNDADGFHDPIATQDEIGRQIGALDEGE